MRWLRLLGQQAWVTRAQFTAKPGEFAWLEDNDEAYVAAGLNQATNFQSLGNLALSLPPGTYFTDDQLGDLQILGWALGAYQFKRYRNVKKDPAKFVIPDANDHDKIVHMADAIALSRDLINTSAADMAPSHMAAEAEALAEQFGAEISIHTGDELLDMECGAIHAVGRAADDEPRLIDFTWGDPNATKITLVGKGVTFDSGGLDIKPASGMRLMKKDMGGAATVMGLAYLIMAQKLNVRLRVLIPCVENAISGNAFRPGDVLHTHKGITVEIDNTDAEGRLILCDALSIACEENPDYLFDFATLTGSARSAVGTEIAAMFCNDDNLAVELQNCSSQQADPVWRMPLHSDYNYMIDSKVADIVNSAASPYAGSVTAALFLQKFVENTRWTHFDIMAFNTRRRPGHPEGGEAMGLRTVYQFIEKLDR